jgi:hypothetical protein
VRERPIAVVRPDCRVFDVIIGLTESREACGLELWAGNQRGADGGPVHGGLHGQPLIDTAMVPPAIGS